MTDSALLHWLRDAPLWATGAVLLVLLLGAREAGVLARRRADARQKDSEPDLTETGFLVSSILGLLALLIGFTFSMALGRFETRQALVNEEARALMMVQHRLLVYPDGASLLPLLHRHADQRRAEIVAGHARAKSLGTGDRLWRRAVTVAARAGSPPLTPFLLDPLDRALDRAAALDAELGDRLQGSVLALLVVYALAGAFTLGLTAPGPRQRSLATMMAVLLVMGLLAILDLDQAGTGRARLSDAAIVALSTPAPAPDTATFTDVARLPRS